MIIRGILKEVDLDTRICVIETFNRRVNVYFRRSLFKKIKLFLNPETYVNLVCLDDLSLRDYIYFYEVSYVNKIKYLVNNRTYYDIDFLEDGLKDFLKSHKNILYLDLEMTMPPYNHKGHFDSEIIQAGFILKNKDGHEVLRYNNYIKPTSDVALNIRTCKFLNIRKSEFYKKAISFYSFYKDFSRVLKKYRPTIIIYGKNDSIMLNKSYQNYNLPSLANISRFVNIASLIEEYYHHNKEYGLFNLYEMYHHKSFVQTHDAFEDAIVTEEVYKAFYNDVINKKYSI